MIQEKISNTTEVAKRIRIELKERFPKCKFSVTSQYYAGGSSIHLDIMESNIKIKKNPEELIETNLHHYIEDGRHTLNSLKELQNCTHHSLSQYSFKEVDEYNPNFWNNGVFLTKDGFEFLKEINKIANFYNWDNSESISDYYDVNYYLDIGLGKWNKPFVDGSEGN